MCPQRPRTNTLSNGLLLGWATDQTPIWDTNREGHLITVAPTGAGKGISAAIPALLTWQGPAIVIDPRGENYAVTAARRRAMGHIVHRLDPFRIAGPQLADSLDPMDLIDPHADDFEDNAAMVAQLCRQNMIDQKSPYWDERASVLITKIICGLFRHMHPRRPTLRDVQNALNNSPRNEFFHRHRKSALITMGEPTDAEKPFTLQDVVTSAEFASDRTFSCIVSSANSHLGFLKSSAVHASVSDSSIMLDDITAGAMHTIYLIIPPDKLVSHSSLLRLWIGVALAAIARRQRAPEQPTLLLIDEAAQLGEMNELRSALTLMRAYGVRVWTMWQCITQLQNLYPKDWTSIINNSAVQMFFGAKAPHSRKVLSDFIGDGMPPAGIPTDSQLLYNGEDFTMVRRANYLTDPLLKGLASPHPFHDTTGPAALLRTA
jgi:type IV secretion system protein VirD4